MMIFFYPNLVVKLAKISPIIVVKNDVIFGRLHSPIISRHNLNPPPPPQADDVICERPHIISLNETNLYDSIATESLNIPAN